MNRNGRPRLSDDIAKRSHIRIRKAWVKPANRMVDILEDYGNDIALKFFDWIAKNSNRIHELMELQGENKRLKRDFEKALEREKNLFIEEMSRNKDKAITENEELKALISEIYKLAYDGRNYTIGYYQNARNNNDNNGLYCTTMCENQRFLAENLRLIQIKSAKYKHAIDKKNPPTV